MLHVDSFGQGDDVFILHGSPQSADELQDMATRIARTHRAHLVHAPGYGKSGHAEDIGSVATANERIADAIRATSSGAPPVLVGVSGGTYRALALVAEGRVDARALVLVSAIAGLAPAHAEGMSQTAAALEAGVDLSEALPPLWFSPSYIEAHPEVVGDAYARALASAPREVIVADLRAFVAAPDLTPALATIRQPVSMIVGSLDLATPLAYSEHIAAQLPNATLTVLEDAGHLLHLERPDEVEAAIRRVL